MGAVAVTPALGEQGRQIASPSIVSESQATKKCCLKTQGERHLRNHTQDCPLASLFTGSCVHPYIQMNTEKMGHQVSIVAGLITTPPAVCQDPLPSSTTQH